MKAFAGKINRMIKIDRIAADEQRTPCGTGGYGG